MGTSCINISSNTCCLYFEPILTSKLSGLFNYYTKVMKFVKQNNFFTERTQRLKEAVSTYLISPLKYDETNLELCAVDSVHKVYPQQYKKGLVSHEWLIAACLRQNNFVQKIDFKDFNFQSCYFQYVEYLYMHKCYPREILIPTMKADFMWHSHMQNHEKYKANMECMLGVILNHSDYFPSKELAKYSYRTECIRNVLYKRARLEKKRIAESSGGDGGGGGCGG